MALLLCAGAARPQQPPAPPPAASTPSPAQSQASAKEREKEKKDTHLSPAQAEELFRSVDALLKFASDDTRLPIRHPVQRQLASRDQVERYVDEQIRKDQSSGRLQRAQSVLKKLGLVPRDLDLQALLLDLMREQVAGYYDPKKQTFYMLDWVEPESQRPVIAHELTHALQDQAVDLQKWIKDTDTDPDDDKPGALEASVAADEEEMAREAVAEGQATAVMMDYLLQPSGQTIVTAQEFVKTFELGMMQSGSFPVFGTAPLYIRESLAFPYRYGLDFVRSVIISKGREAAFLGLLQHPPSTTREIMDPKTYLAGEPLPPLHIPPLAAVLGDGYQRYDVGAMGEFDVDVLLEQFDGERTAQKLSPHWRGGYYYTAVRRTAAAAPADAKQLRRQSIPPESLALLYVSRWDNPATAEKFAKAYLDALPQRYHFARRAPENPKPQSFAERVANHTKWLTDQGGVFVEPWGETVLVMEGFDDATAARLRDAVLGRAAEAAAKP